MKGRQNPLVLIEAGASTTKNAYDPTGKFEIDYNRSESNPIDTLVLSVVSGVRNQEAFAGHIGSTFAPMHWI